MHPQFNTTSLADSIEGPLGHIGPRSNLCLAHTQIWDIPQNDLHLGLWLLQVKPCNWRLARPHLGPSACWLLWCRVYTGVYQRQCVGAARRMSYREQNSCRLILSMTHWCRDFMRAEEQQVTLKRSLAANGKKEKHIYVHFPETTPHSLHKLVSNEWTGARRRPNHEAPTWVQWGHSSPSHTLTTSVETRVLTSLPTVAAARKSLVKVKSPLSPARLSSGIVFLKACVWRHNRSSARQRWSTSHLDVTYVSHDQVATWRWSLSTC